ncbi:hypothetical protein [Spirillospora sp. NPDC048824]|uniref:hypothetical protein n=1 Tax=Spirillospora sp. NPDC048824 TaxID=3364526 RepID=UPI00371050A7
MTRPPALPTPTSSSARLPHARDLPGHHALALDDPTHLYATALSALPANTAKSTMF